MDAYYRTQPTKIQYIVIFRGIPEFRLIYKCVFIIYAYHGDIRALLPGSNCDIHRPGVLFIRKSSDFDQIFTRKTADFRSKLGP